LFVLEGILHVDIEVFMLIFVRMTGLFVIAPIFGSRNIPTYCKIGFSFMTALILVNTIKVQELYFSNIYEYFILVLKEFLVGITLGYVAYMISRLFMLRGSL